MSYTNAKEGALKLLIVTANKHKCKPADAIIKTKELCDSLITFHQEVKPSMEGYVKYWTRYYTRVKQWLDREDLTAF